MDDNALDLEEKAYEADPRVRQMMAAAEKIKDYKFGVPPFALVIPPHSEEASPVPITISKSLLMKLAGHGRTQKFMSLWYNILGMIPPVPNIGFHEDAANDAGATQILQAHALLQGLDRPCGTSDKGENVYCYVLNPQYTYECIPHGVCMARRTSAPKDSVLVVYVRFHDNYQSLDGMEIAGEIVGWEFLIADDAAPSLPAGFDTKKMVWRRNA